MRDYAQRAAESAQRNGTMEAAATWIAEEAFAEAEFGNWSYARQARPSTPLLKWLRMAALLKASPHGFWHEQGIPRRHKELRMT
jgi:hypothetical protein